MITSMKRSLQSSKTWYRSMLAGNPKMEYGAYELISTTVLSSTATSVTFSSIPSTYKHLQIRYVASYDAAYTDIYIAPLRFNGDSGANYAHHRLSGASTNGFGLPTGVSSAGYSGGYTSIQPNFIGDSQRTNYFGGGVIDILDYAQARNKTTRTLSGSAPYGVILGSGVWMSTAAVTSLTLTGPFIAGSRFSLYGILG